MAVTLISTAKAFSPGMIGDVVEVTAYDTRTGETSKAVGTLRSYNVGPGVLAAEFEGDRDVPALKVATEGITLTINHYEFVYDLDNDTEDSE